MTTPITSANTATTATSTSSSSSTGALTSDFDTFLQMLTAQMRYQDPLEPIESSEYAAQLAQFSMVEQQVQSNDLLTGLLAQLNQNSMTAMSQWVGMEARAQTAGYFDGTNTITVAPNPAAASDDVQLAVYNEEGEEVDRVQLPISADPYVWDGVDSDGNVLPKGSYTFGLESYEDETLILSEVAEVYAEIKEAQLIGEDMVLILEGGSAILSTSVTSLRNPA